jgi:hypothetical protein
MDIIMVPEEEIYSALILALGESFSTLVEVCNAARGEEWIEGFSSVLETGESMELKPLSLVRVKMDEVKRKSSDPFVEQTSFLVTLDCRFDLKSPSYTPYRYAALLKELFKTDETLRGLIDGFILEECFYYPLDEDSASGYPEASYKISLFRNDLK